MQINKVSADNFGAMPDIPTRNLLKRANLHGINTEPTEDLMKGIHADKYIIMSVKPNNITEINLLFI